MEQRLYRMLQKTDLKISAPKEKQRIKANLALLREGFTQEQKRLLMQIVDDLDEICCITQEEAYVTGFRKATAIMIESLYDWPKTEMLENEI